MLKNYGFFEGIISRVFRSKIDKNHQFYIDTFDAVEQIDLIPYLVPVQINTEILAKFCSHVENKKKILCRESRNFAETIACFPTMF